MMVLGICGSPRKEKKSGVYKLGSLDVLPVSAASKTTSAR
jgi:hypothetical protein